MKFQSVILLLTSLFLFYSCEKELSYEGGLGGGGGSSSGTAVYTFEGGTGSCTDAVVSGTYAAGTALTATNTVTLQVNVATIGTYILSSATVNGISFKGSGTFTSTGVQAITLTGAGTPAAAGTFNLPIGSNGCSIIVVVSGTSGSEAAFTLGGSPGACTGFNVAGSYMAGSALVASNTVTFNVNVTTIGSYTISTAAVNGVTFSKSGSFTTTGDQTVILNGTGTPVAAGDATYTVTAGANSCTFVVTTTAAAPPAVGTLDCAGITQQGTYTQGSALTAANTLTIPVNVTTEGSYSITTAAVNGVTFSGSGTLASGAQTIILAGSGTPASAGDNSFSVDFGTSNCSISVTFLPGTNSSTDYLKCNINGVAATFNVDVSGTDVPMPMGSAFSIDGQTNTDLSSPGLSLAITNLSGSIGNGTYNLVSATNLTKICLPVYSDGTNTWTQATANQPGTFSVIVTAKTANRITGTFSGTLYENNGAGPASAVFTNGEFSVPY
jgi:hypothetical protein